jgi:hypothetical protein
MKTFRAKKGPFQERPFYSTQEIEQICVDELSAAGFLPARPEAVRIERFIEKRFGLTLESTLNGTRSTGHWVPRLRLFSYCRLLPPR